MEVNITLNEKEIEMLFDLEQYLYKRNKTKWYELWKLNEKIAIDMDKQDGEIRATQTLINKLKGGE